MRKEDGEEDGKEDGEDNGKRWFKKDGGKLEINWREDGGKMGGEMKERYKGRNKDEEAENKTWKDGGIGKLKQDSRQEAASEMWTYLGFCLDVVERDVDPGRLSPNDGELGAGGLPGEGGNGFFELHVVHGNLLLSHAEDLKVIRDSAVEEKIMEEEEKEIGRSKGGRKERRHRGDEEEERRCLKNSAGTFQSIPQTEHR